MNKKRQSIKDGFYRLISDKPYYPWLVWGLGAAFFFAEYFARLAPNVMVGPLMQAFHLDALGIGILFSYFYWPYIAMQLPVGVLVDRYGAHKMLMIMAAACALSCYLFSWAHTLWAVNLSRFILGVAGAFAFVSTLKLATIWFPANMFGLLAGATQAIGMLGASVGEGPVAMAVAHIGWRATLAWMGASFLLLSLLVGACVREKKGHQSTKVSSYQGLWGGLKFVLKNKQTWYNALFASLIFAPTGTFAELWGVTYVEHVHHLPHVTAAKVISVIFLGWGIGGPLIGGLSDRWRLRKPFMYGSALASLLFLSLVLYCVDMPIWLLCALMFAYGMANSGLVTAYALSGEINPQLVSGISMAFANMASVLLAPLFQDLGGWILVHRWQGAMSHGIPFYDVLSYQWSTVMLPVSLLIAFFIAFKIEETHCQRIEERDA